jgi:hypothetical protein
VQRPYNFHGHDFARRSYSYHGHEYSHFYHDYHFAGGDDGGGVDLNVFAPATFFPPAFYGWAYNTSVASNWLTDYMIAQDLQAVNAAQQEAGEVNGDSSAANGPPALPPEVEQQVANEVKNQLALENQEAQQNAQHQDVDPISSGLPRILAEVAGGHTHIFMVGGALDVVDASQTECSLSDGDVLALMTPPQAGATAADLVVLVSKGGNECKRSSTVTVPFTDLQEMQNRMRELIDQGLQELQNMQGKKGMPQAPPSAQSPPVPAQYALIAPPADPNAAAEIQEQAQQSDQAETDVSNEASQADAAPAASPRTN